MLKLIHTFITLKSSKDSNGKFYVDIPRNSYIDLKYTEFSRNVKNVRLCGNGEYINITIPFEECKHRKLANNNLYFEDKYIDNIDTNYLLPMGNLGFVHLQLYFDIDDIDDESTIEVTFDSIQCYTYYYPFWVTIKDILRSDKEQMNMSINKIIDYTTRCRPQENIDTYILGGRYATYHHGIVDVRNQSKKRKIQ